MEHEAIDEVAPGEGRRSRQRRRPGLALGLGAGFVAGALVAGAGAAWAGHQFSDVPGTNSFHGDIAWMADQGIADGYADGTFKPTNPVSRQAMSAFMHRLSNRTVVRSEVINPDSGSAWQITVDCLPGERAIGGTGEATNAGNPVVIIDSRPLGALSSPDGWVTAFASQGGATVDPVSIVGYATCVPDL